MFVFLNGNKFDLSAHGTLKRMAYDGSHGWVITSTNKLIRLGLIDKSAYTTDVVDISSSIDGFAHYLTTGNGYVWVFDSITPPGEYDEKFITHALKIDPVTQTVLQKIQLPWQAHCFPICAANKLWFSTPATKDNSVTPQQLFYYDLLTGLWSSKININSAKQFTARRFHHGSDQYVFTASYNGNSVVKFNATNGAQVSEILINRKPMTMWTNGNRDLLVGSFSGMVSTIDVDLDTSSNDYSTNGEALGLVDDDGGFLWAIQPNLVRVKKADTTDNFRIMDGQDKDYSIEAFSDTVFQDIILTRPYTHNSWDISTSTIISKTEKQSVLLLAPSAVYIAYDFTDSWNLRQIRDYDVTVNGSAIIATGPDSYFGEVPA